MAATLLNWTHIHPSLHWGRPIIESVLLVMERPRYQLKINGSEANFNDKVHSYERAASRSLHASFDVYHDGEYIARLSVTVKSDNVSANINSMIAMDRDGKVKPFISYRDGRGRLASRLKRYGHLKRPGIRKWAVCSVQSILHSKANLAASHVMET